MYFTSFYAFFLIFLESLKHVLYTPSCVTILMRISVKWAETPSISNVKMKHLQEKNLCASTWLIILQRFLFIILCSFLVYYATNNVSLRLNFRWDMAQLLLKFLCLISHLSYSGGIYVGWEKINVKKSVSGVNVRLNCFIVCWGVLHVGEKERFEARFVSKRKETQFSKKFTLNTFDSILFAKCKFFLNK